MPNSDFERECWEINRVRSLEFLSDFLLRMCNDQNQGIMEKVIFAVLLFFASISRADQFIFPEDMNAISNAPNPIFYVGEPQTFIWSTSAASVTLNLWQDETDNSDILCQNCTTGTFTWNGVLTQDLSKGAVFFLQLSDGGTATSRDFNISVASSPPSVTAAPSSSPSHQVEIPNTSGPSSAASTLSLPPSTTSTSTTSTFHLSLSIPPPSTPTQHTANPSTPPFFPSPHLSSSILSTRTSTSTPTPTPTPSFYSKPKAPPAFTPLKITLTIGLPILSLGVLTTLFFLYRRKNKNKLVRADSPPAWGGPMTMDVMGEERKGGREGWGRVEMEVPGPGVLHGLGEVKDGGKGEGGGGDGKAELGTSDTGEKMVREMGVELP